jgi:hypothetical protein
MAAARPVVWDGDWNQAPRGHESAGTDAGRRAIKKQLCETRLASTNRRPGSCQGRPVEHRPHHGPEVIFCPQMAASTSPIISP